MTIVTFAACRPVPDATKAKWRADRSWLVFRSKDLVMSGRLCADSAVNRKVAYVELLNKEEVTVELSGKVRVLSSRSSRKQVIAAMKEFSEESAHEID